MSDRPKFRYHPDSVATGSATPSDEPCHLRGQPAGFKYQGPIYGGQAEILCLGCIADGTAARRLGGAEGPAEFTDVGWGVPADVPQAVLGVVSQETPGFFGWQPEHWLYHCSDAAAFLGRVGWDDIREMPDAQTSLLVELTEAGVDAEEADRQLRLLHPDGDLTGYLFQCLHCGTHLAYPDAN